MRSKKRGRPPRPEPLEGDLGLLQAFVNTRDLDAGTDNLGGPAAMRLWLDSRGIAVESVDEALCHEAQRFREALRDVLTAHALGTAAAGAAKRLNALMGDELWRVHFDDDGRPDVRPRPETNGWLNLRLRLLHIIVTASHDQRWGRLKACKNPECRWVFYDRSKNHSGLYCNSQRCAGALYCERHRQRYPHRFTKERRYPGVIDRRRSEHRKKKRPRKKAADDSGREIWGDAPETGDSGKGQ